MQHKSLGGTFDHREFIHQARVLQSREYVEFSQDMCG